MTTRLERGIRSIPLPLAMVITAIVYLGVARLSLLLAFPNTNVSPFWPPSGIALAAMVLWGFGVWPGIFLGAVSANIWLLSGTMATGLPVAMALSAVTAIGNILEALIGRWLLFRYCKPATMFNEPRSIISFLIIGGMLCLPASVIGPLALCTAGIAQWHLLTRLCLTWWIGDLIGILILTPFILTWVEPQRAGTGWKHTAGKILGVCLLIEVLAIEFGTVFKSPFVHSTEYLVFLILLWIAFRSGRRTLVSALTIASIVIVTGTARGHGPFILNSTENSLLYVQEFLIIATVTMLIISSSTRMLRTTNISLLSEISERTQAEYALQEAQRFNQTVMYSTPGIVYIIDIIDNKLVYRNRTFAEHLGYSAEERARMDDLFFIRLIHPEDMPVMISIPEKWDASGDETVITTEYRLQHKNGQWRWFTARDTIFKRNAAGKVQQIIGMAYDITDRKNALDALRVARDTAQRYLDIVEAIIVALNCRGEVQLINRKGSQMLGYNPEELEGQNWFDRFVPDEERETSRTSFKQMVNGSMPPVEFMENAVVTKSGGELLISWHTTLMRSESGRTTGTLSAGTDITARKRAEIEVKRLNEELERKVIERTNELQLKTEEVDNFFTLALDLLCIADTDGCFRRLNRSWESILGYRTEDLEGKKFLDFVHPDDLPATHSALGKLADKKDVLDFVNRYRCRDGSYRWIEWRATPAGSKTIYAAARDITERKRFEQELMRAKEVAETATRTKSEFLANMSHEIRTPMNAVIGFTELLSAHARDERDAQYLTSIMTAAKSLLRLINDILDLSKLDAGKMKINQTAVSFQPILEEIMQIFSAMIEEKGLYFSINIDPSLPPVFMLDEIRLRQVLLNLIGNAVKFTESGSISVSAAPLSTAKIDGPTVDLLITVADTGKGIPSDYLHTIFEPFHQGGNQNVKYGGTGLGLSISRKLVEMMHGTITVESTVGQGSAFCIHLWNVAVPSPLQAANGQGATGAISKPADCASSLVLTETALGMLRNEIMPLVNECVGAVVMERVQMLASRLHDYGTRTNETAFLEWSRRLANAASCFNIAAIKKIVAAIRSSVTAR